MKNIKDFIMEDSLDDFDIDGKIAKKRNAVSEQVKNKAHQKISKCIDKMYKLCDEYFSNNNFNITKTDKYLDSDKYKIYFPDLNWGFTYSPENVVHFQIVIGHYGKIDQTRDIKECKKILNDLSDYIKQNIKNIDDYVNIWKDSPGGITSGSWFLELSIKLKDINI